MPLNKPLLRSGIQDVAAEPPPTAAECAQAWASAVQDSASAIVPASATVAAAGSALSAALTAAFNSPAAAPQMETAFATFAATVGGGMAPAFVATPPAGPVGFAPLFAGPKPATHADAATALSNLVHTWMRTGSAAPSAGGPPALWS